MIMEMDDEELFENNNEDLKEPMLDRNKNYRKTQIKKIIILLFIFLLIIIFLILIIFFSITNQSRPTNELFNYGEIFCTYTINDIDNKISLINQNYSNDPNISVIIDGNNETIPFINSYKFNTKGNHNITFLLNKQNLDMNNIFKDISSLTSVILISENASQRIYNR